MFLVLHLTLRPCSCLRQSILFVKCIWVQSLALSLVPNHIVHSSEQTKWWQEEENGEVEETKSSWFLLPCDPFATTLSVAELPPTLFAVTPHKLSRWPRGQNSSLIFSLKFIPQRIWRSFWVPSKWRHSEITYELRWTAVEHNPRVCKHAEQKHKAGLFYTH